MALKSSVLHLVRGAQAGSETATQELWNRYFAQLVGLARKKLGDLPRRSVDEEDVALSAFNSFCQGVRQGRFPKIDDHESLWPLLVVITARKASDYRQHAGRQKRGGGRTVGESALAIPGDSRGLGGLGQVVGREPTPEFAALVVEQYRQLLERLPDPRARRVVELKLEGFTNDEIALRLEVTRRTVERKLRRVRSLLEAETG